MARPQQQQGGGPPRTPKATPVEIKNLQITGDATQARLTFLLTQGGKPFRNQDVRLYWASADNPMRAPHTRGSVPTTVPTDDFGWGAIDLPNLQAQPEHVVGITVLHSQSEPATVNLPWHKGVTPDAANAAAGEADVQSAVPELVVKETQVARGHYRIRLSVYTGAKAAAEKVRVVASGPFTLDGQAKSDPVVVPVPAKGQVLDIRFTQPELDVYLDLPKWNKQYEPTKLAGPLVIERVTLRRRALAFLSGNKHWLTVAAAIALSAILLATFQPRIRYQHLLLLGVILLIASRIRWRSATAQPSGH